MNNSEVNGKYIPHKGELIFRSNNMVKAGDIIDVSVSVELLDVPDDLSVINVNEFNQRYYVNYYVQGTNLLSSFDFEVEAGFIPSFDGDIEAFIKEDLPIIFEEITDYEIFDIDNSDCDNLSAKVRVKAVANK